MRSFWRKSWRARRRVKKLCTGFTERRYERCRMVVENSVRLGDLERAGGPPQEHQQLMRRVDPAACCGNLMPLLDSDSTKKPSIAGRLGASLSRLASRLLVAS